ncbi:hypothetical protein GWI33_007448 [Rhynchophorus ferrugineus]|uniref:Uncharacterized protein n=1 Tax=Rhynchophorus ferrugineus TaxID=354439 RepID=A0A834MC25_RHYFE|nr:hypothetical protein GWI33_007448 [Rhynchophorus ferrugineus]
MDKKEFRVLIKYCFLKGKNTVEEKTWLDAEVPENQPSRIGMLSLDVLCARWVPRELTFNQKQRRVENSEQCLKITKRNKSELLHRYVTMDETRPHHFTPKSNRESSEWTAHDFG